MNVFLGTFDAGSKVTDSQVFFSRLLDEAGEMISMCATSVDSKRHDLNLHDYLVIADSANLGSLESACYFDTLSLRLIYFDESLNNVFLK